MDRLTSRRVCRHAGFLLATLTWGPAWSSAQAVQRGVVASPPVPVTTQNPPRDSPPPPPRVGTAVLKGQVVDGVTGNPIARARVRLMNNPGQKPAVLADSTGAFEFTALPQGPLSVMVEKSTYLTGRFPEANRSLRAAAQPFLVRDGQVVQIVVPMFRGGAIAGRVVDAHGDPVDFAQVRVLRAPRGGRPTNAGQAQTNDLGEYRVPRLQPGRYVLQVRPSMQSQFNSSQDPSIAESPLPQPVPTYYPNAQSLAQAQSITVGRGETISGVDLTLAEGVPTLVTGTVLRSDGEVVSGGSISTRFTGPEATFGFDGGGGTGIRPGGTFRLTLSPGEYTFEAQVASRQGPGVGPNEQLFGSSRVVVGGAAIEEVTIMVGRGATASGKVVFDGTSQLPPSPGQTRVPLYNPGVAGCRPAELTVAPDWSFKIEGLNGSCGAQPASMFGRWTLKAFTIRGRNLMDELMTFENGQHYTNVQIVVTDKRTLMDLRVSGDDGQPTREYVAIAFPVDKEKWTSPLRPVRTYVPQQVLTIPRAGAAPPGASVLSSATPATYPTGGNQGPQERFLGLAAGEYLCHRRRRHPGRGFAGSGGARTPRYERVAGQIDRRGPPRGAIAAVHLRRPDTVGPCGRNLSGWMRHDEDTRPLLVRGGAGACPGWRLER